MIFGGQTTTVVANTESWNGTSWTEVADLATVRDQQPGAGASSSSAIAFGGNNPSNSAVANTEEFSFPPPTSAILTEGDLFLSGGATLKGFGRAGN